MSTEREERPEIVDAEYWAREICSASSEEEVRRITSLIWGYKANRANVAVACCMVLADMIEKDSEMASKYRAGILYLIGGLAKAALDGGAHQREMENRV